MACHGGTREHRFHWIPPTRFAPPPLRSVPHQPPSSDLFEVVCVGCPDECDECHFDERVPICIGLSEAGVEHADSPGGVITVEELVIHEGYWRATETSTNVLECYNKDACLGGVKIGSCSQGYEGPCESQKRNQVGEALILCVFYHIVLWIVCRRLIVALL